MENILLFIIGAVFIVLGIMQTKGNISLMHSYHRKRVSEKDKLPFGRLTGSTMIIIGGAMIVQGVLTIVGNVLQNEIFETIGGIVLIASFVVGIGLAIYAMIKYNKGIF